MNTDSCDMRKVEMDTERSLWDMNPGEFYYHTDKEGQRWMICMLPSQTPASLPLRPLLSPATNGGHSWEFSGTEDKPTLTPSVNSTGGWHGWIKEGRMVSC